MIAVGCPAPEDLEGMLDGSLAADRIVEIEAHVDECSACRVALGELAGDAATVDADDTVQERPISTRRARGAQPTQIDRYQVDRKLGAGGMGVVLLARDPELDRKVVIKLLHPELTSETSRGRQRLLREAQAMAKVSHPNVVPIFDVGVHDEQVFIAMEYLDGGDLASWLRASHGMREILDVFGAAGRGLAAAHRAGLVHRDFKPHNVILGSHGEVKVSDFGLARPGGDSGEREPQPATRASLLDTPLTHAGTIIGTPAYMAPEQIRGQELDARADQFSFCVALYQAVHGQLPFTGKDTAEVFNATLDAKLPEPAGGRRVPRRVRRVLERGLAAVPSDRYPTMDALLADLAPRPRWVLPAIATAVMLVAAGAGLLWTRRAPSELCAGDAEALASVWNASRRQAIEHAFGDGGHAVTGAIDKYGEAWRAGHRDACRATRVRGDQSEAVMTERMHCLRRRREELAALVDLLERPDDALRSDGAGAVARLTSPAVCANVDTLAPKPVVDDIVEQNVAKATALIAAQRFQAAADVLGTALERAKKVGDKRLLGEVHYQLGVALTLKLGWAEGEPHLQQAAQLADEVSDDRTRALALIQLLAIATAQNKLDDAERWLQFGRAAVKRIGNDPTISAALEARAADLEAERGQGRSAEQGYRHAIEQMEILHGAASGEVISAHRELASFLTQQMRYDDAYAELEQARAIAARNGDLESVNFAATLELMSLVRQYQRRYDDSVSLGRDALALMTKQLGADNPQLAQTYTSLALSLQFAGKTDEAIEMMNKGIDLAGKFEGTKSPFYVGALMQLGTLYANAGKRDDAYATFARVVEITTSIYGTDQHKDVVVALNAMGSLRRQQGKLDEAATILKRSYAIVSKLQPGSALMSDTLTRSGIVQRHRKNYGDAIRLLDQSLTMATETKSGPNVTGWIKFELAQALWDGKGDRARATTLASEAVDELEHAGDSELAGEARTWLAARPH